MYRPEPQTRRLSSRKGPDSSQDSGPSLEPQGSGSEDPWLAQRQTLHDAANWITVLRGHVEALGEVDEPGLRARHVELARRAARAAHRLCALPPVTARPPSGSLQPAVHIERLMAHLKGQAREAAVELDLRVECEAAALVDGPGFDDAMLNLLRNAIEATPRGGQVFMQVVEAPRGWIRVQIDDTGAGIPQEMRARLGEAGISTRAGTDRGLGLSRVRAWLEAAGSSLEVGASPSGGARMAFAMPVARVSASAARPTKRSVTALDVLLIEDDLAVAEVLELLLAADGHQVTRFADCRDTLAGFVPGAFDLVLCDQNLPDGLGSDLLVEIAAIDPGPLRYLVTGDPHSSQHRGDSINGVLAKPVSRDDLRRVAARTRGCESDESASPHPARQDDA